MNRIRPKQPRLRLDPESYEQTCQTVFAKGWLEMPSMRHNVEP